MPLDGMHRTSAECAVHLGGVCPAKTHRAAGRADRKDDPEPGIRSAQKLLAKHLAIKRLYQLNRIARPGLNLVAHERHFMGVNWRLRPTNQSTTSLAGAATLWSDHASIVENPAARCVMVCTSLCYTRLNVQRNLPAIFWPVVYCGINSGLKWRSL